ncbi:MAG: outer membrane beta-barrel family protein, partial [Bacteroidota bacterium]|nr:outer membrane beta-barrel family protein [Bacteroidota bacterium]
NSAYHLTNSEDKMWTRLAVAFCIIAIFSSCLFGQKSNESFSLSGVIMDELNGKALVGATILALSAENDKTLSGTITDKKGNFIIDKIPQKYVRLRMSMVGYQSVLIDSIDLGHNSQLGLIKLKQTAFVMPEIVIKSLKPMIEFHADRQILNIDRLPGNSGSVTEALRSSGIVEVDPQSNKITVRGQSVKLQMDGHQYEASNDLLSQMPASLLDQVEVILSPGAKESAEGGTYILNLVSKKNKFDNYSGSVSISTSPNANNYGGLNLNYRVGKLNLFGQAWYSYYEFHAKGQSERFNYLSHSMFYTGGSIEGSNYSSTGNVKLGFDYDFNDKTSMTFYTSFNTSKVQTSYCNNTIINNEGNIFQYGYENKNDNIYKFNTLSLYGFLKKKFEAKGHELTFDAYFTSFRNPVDSKMNIDYTNRLSMPQMKNSYLDVNAKTLILKSDYSLPLGKNKLEMGYNFTFRDRMNDYNVNDYSYIYFLWRDSLNLSNSFKYKESIHALYVTYAHKLGGFDIKGGLRMEDLITCGDQLTSSEKFSGNFLNLFPNLNLSYKFNDNIQLGFTSFRRVTYPVISCVNPFKQYKGPNSYFAGNPKLKPSYIYSYAFNLSQYINVYYVYSTGLFTYAAAVENDSTIVDSYINLDNNKTYGIDLTWPYYNTPASLIHLPDFVSMLNIKYSFLYRDRKGKYVNEDLSYIDRNYTLSVNLGLNLFYDISTNISFYFRPETENKMIHSSQMKDLSLYISRSFFEKKLRLSFSCYDLLNAQKYDNQTIASNYSSKSSYRVQNSRYITFGITYMFNDFKERRDRNIDDGRDGKANGGTGF